MNLKIKEDNASFYEEEITFLKDFFAQLASFNWLVENPATLIHDTPYFSHNVKSKTNVIFYGHLFLTLLSINDEPEFWLVRCEEKSHVAIAPIFGINEHPHIITTNGYFQVPKMPQN